MAKSLPTVGLGALIAFFPKCPACWALYLSMFGSFGLAQMPYLTWLLPLLLLFMGLHLLFLLKKARAKGYGPFLLSLAGAIIIALSRIIHPLDRPVLIAGMLLILAGSLWNSFSAARLIKWALNEFLWVDEVCLSRG